jgi:sigma-B regulation protein RsbU (phosphoserine phosphatase)
MRHSVINLRLRAILCVPLRIKDNIIGVVYVDNRLQAGIFSAADLELLNAIAASAAIAVENARLYQVAVDKGRLERELQVAREVQAGLLPSETPQVPGWEFVARWRPARTVAGDYYDFITTEDGRLGLVIADVTDKGMPAALFMTLTRSTVRASVRLAATPADGIAHANQLICADSTRGMFVTLAYVLLDPGARTLTCVNAGHNPPLHYHAAEDRLDALPRTGLPLGVDATLPFTQTVTAIQPGDFLVLYTDGLTEANDARRQEFGVERLQAVLRAHCRAPAADIAAALERALDEFTGDVAPHDDVTLVVARCLA